MTVRQLTPPGPPPPMTERELQASVIALCRWLHLLCYHTHDARHSAAGFPDLVIVGRGRVLFRELKSASGELRKDQTTWACALSETDDGLCDECAAAREWPPAYQIWRPADWYAGRIREQLEAVMFTAYSPRRPR